MNGTQSEKELHADVGAEMYVSPKTGTVRISACPGDIFSLGAIDLKQLDDFKFYRTGTLGEGDKGERDSFYPTRLTLLL